MLAKLFTYTGGDYERSLKTRRWLALGLLLVGLVGIGCYVLLVRESDLPDFARGFYLGAASGITAGALVLLIRVQYLLTHPQAQKKARIQETDERERAIVHTSFEAAGVITFFLSAAALFVVLPLSMAAFRALLAVMALYSVSFLGANLYLSRKL